MARTNATPRQTGDAKKQKKQKSAVVTESSLTNAGLPVTTAKRANSKKRLKQTEKESGTMTPEERHRKIAIAAYYRAEQRGFRCRCSEQDWFDAAAEIDNMT